MRKQSKVSSREIVVAYIGDSKLLLVINTGNCSFTLRHKVELCDVIAEQQFVCSAASSGR